MHIAIISGSNRMGRKSHGIAQYLEKTISERPEVEKVTMLDVHEYNFPVMDERRGRLDDPHPGLEEFGKTVESCDAVVIVTPEYNGGMAGSLKNTLDYFRPEFDHKVMTAVTVSSGSFGGVNALHQLWFWMNYVGGIITPQKLLVSHVNDVFDENGEVQDERFLRNSGKTIDDLIWLAQKIMD
ncbi:NADPH-dependent FMN reductase [Phaeocystidibacter luteus]|uniref:NAD(P)H-dependent oxidoreductase n=1 Tax=Phaeocystidibacter luteus TaxID=911197 RepID=A0A6N6RFX6_9FLAO|nr:NAD(P)H-dependent oxidoreductase [Phaeocystidibacter luteus]KAB2808668.1 NAD(P)H-dependent oxidoreductase [Phaeocystidibacter luteus]